MAIEPRITVRLGSLRKGWASFCKSRDVSEAEGVRILIGNALKPTKQGGIVCDTDETKPKARLELRLTVSELDTLKTRAEGAGFTVNRYIVAMIRAGLTESAQFGEQELMTLADSNYQLSAIGRNLNMLARDLKATPGTIEPYRFKVLEHLKKQIDEHLKYTHGLIQANLARWKRAGR